MTELEKAMVEKFAHDIADITVSAAGQDQHRIRLLADAAFKAVGLQKDILAVGIEIDFFVNHKQLLRLQVC